MPLEDAQRLRLRAIEAMIIADQMRDPVCKRAMITIAAGYERLAEHAEECEAINKPDHELTLSPQRRN
jgi:hypothetical protein